MAGLFSTKQDPGWLILLYFLFLKLLNKPAPTVKGIFLMILSSISRYYLDYIKNNSYAHGAWTFPRHFVGSPWICDPFPWEYLLPVGSLTIVISMKSFKF